MNTGSILKHRGRIVTEADISFIRDLLERQPTASRRKLSKLLCQAWGWRQPNGNYCDMICRGLMLALHRAGHITLPAPRQVSLNNILRRGKPLRMDVDTSPLKSSLKEALPLTFQQARGLVFEEKLFESLIEHYHYLGYTRPVGEHLKYLVSSNGRPLACLAFSSAPRHLGPRDRFIGWTPQARRRNIHLVAYNPRFLIPPWVEVRYLASHVLSRVARMLPDEWSRLYGHPAHFLETFVDFGRFRGTCYRAANWQLMGQTTGRGKDDQTHKPNRSIKDVWGIPLTPRFRELLCGAG